MKLLSIFLFLACISASAGGNAQSVSISGKSLTYHQVFIAIKKQTGYVVMYNQKVLPSDKKFDLSVRDILLTELLDLILKDEHLKYHIEHKTIFISKSFGAFEFIDDGLQAFISDTMPRLNVKGRVVNERGEPVPGASVMVKNTGYGTSTSADGYFELKNIEENAILVISAVNLEPHEVKVNGRADLSSIVVKSKIIEEEEVIVKTNYWETKQRYNPGNISKVNGIEIQRSPVSNPIDALQGRVSGLQITPLTG
ncbi:MAG TPA: carboxypeptidase-like regulatory domain-containing protein, partial [Parasegetibacter sp.]